MKNIFIFSSLFMIFLAGCARQEINNTVIIHSVPADSIFAEIELYDPSAEHADIIFQGGTTFRFDADTVMVRGFYSCSNGNNFHTQVFITPGDSVSFRAIFKERTNNWRCLNYYEVIFEGENAAHYNYASEKRKAIPSEEEPGYSPGTHIDLQVYKQQLQAYRDREIEFLSNYRKKQAVSGTPRAGPHFEYGGSIGNAAFSNSNKSPRPHRRKAGVVGFFY